MNSNVKDSTKMNIHMYRHSSQTVYIVFIDYDKKLDEKDSIKS